MTSESLAFWNRLSPRHKTMIAAIKDLSYTHGQGIPYEDELTPVLTQRLHCSARSVAGYVRGLNTIGLTKSDTQLYNSSMVRCLWLTDKGRDFILEHQKIIDDWSRESTVSLQ